MTTVAYLGLGANLGDTHQSLKDAIVSLAQNAGIKITGRSEIYRSAPVDATGDDYLNCAIRLETTLSARQLLTLCLSIEKNFGRERSFRNAPRTLDLDLLLYGDKHINEPDLLVPHPCIAGRAFVLLPLRDLDFDLEIPGIGRVTDLLPHVAKQRIELLTSSCCPNRRTSMV
ncbi:2-amino-4-hydroxy-6-hydroxymethyldihydropteridine diphosphokinase [Candidatus Pandoraea novymonadis]|uniref:2-amino-4-hydroxy-6-hydroxymethyldihydropteridine pyrophosphokinase n=1 Tax=Candidatus Pandoraea novymonadis TaxID=1808959 RepID=A0ABX5FDS0_9BURK|nr:2-amino-4-hydroxy-6-hydroxymethyldihydropteridine diphosphokinase [Candidatus Pandoraea novymonadis]PSB91881.1 2-amino-4-hydroxy-6-hydroxymethyldihydropteridine pyrophosphokinase [Candidatus Pandoraea novymonadis]